MSRPAARIRARLTSSAARLTVACLGALTLAAPARADLKVRSPIVERREAEYSQSVIPHEPSEIVLGPILQKEAPGPFGTTMLHTLKAFFTKEVGHDRSHRTGLFLAAQSRLRLHLLFEPGVEIYCNVDDVGRPGRLADQEVFVGPAFTGAYALGRVGLLGAVKYEAGYLFGATPQTPRGAVRWRFEYELSF